MYPEVTVDAHGIRLRRSADRDLGPVLARLTTASRVGLPGVLADLDRAGSPARVRAPAASWGFRWHAEDDRSRRWWPQGVTTSADHDPSELYDGRPVVLTSWYAKDRDGRHEASRISVVDLTEEARPRYRHVALVEAAIAGDQVRLDPMRIHAGGIVWHGEHLHVAATARGTYVFRLDDILRVESAGGGHRYLLPVRFSYDAVTDDGHERMRYSFLSLDRTGREPRLVAGEYGRGDMTTRLVEFGLDPAELVLDLADDGVARPASLSPHGVLRMQGAAVVDGRWYVTSSHGRYRRGSMYVGRPGAFECRPGVLPTGVEDLSYWPGRDELWSLSEYPRRRAVFAMHRSDLG